MAAVLVSNPVNAQDPTNAQTDNEVFNVIGEPIPGVQSFLSPIDSNSPSPRSPASSVRAVQIQSHSPSPATAIQVEPTSLTMKYRATLSPRIVERHDLGEKEKQKEEEERWRVLKAEVDWSVENRMKGERSEWQKALQAFHSFQVVQFDQIVTDRMSQAMSLIDKFASAVEACLRELEIDRTQREELFAQLRLGLDGYKESLGRVLDTHLQWRGLQEQNSKLVNDRVHKELVTIGAELDMLHRQSHGHMEHQQSQIEGFIDKQKALEEMHSARHADVISVLENHRNLHEEAVTNFARVEDQSCFATQEDVRHVEEFVRQFAVPTDTHRDLEERLHMLSVHVDKKWEAMQASIVEVVRIFDDRLQFIAPLDGHSKLEEGMRNIEENLSNFCSVHSGGCRHSRESHTQMFRKSDEHAQQNNDLHGFVEAAHMALSLDVEKFEKLSFDHSSRLTKMESRLDAEVSNWNAKLEECCVSLESECQANYKLLREESKTRTHVFEELKEKLNQHGAAHMDLVASHQVLSSLLNELSISHLEQQKMHTDSKSCLESRFDANCELRLLEPGAAEEKRDVEIATLRDTLKRLEESLPLDCTKFETRCAAIESLIQEHQGMCESRFYAIEPRLDTAAFELSSLHEEVTAGLTNLRKKIEDAESAPQRTFQNSQQQALDEAHKAQQHLPSSLREETRLQVVGFQEISKKMENDMSALTRKCDTLKLDSTKEFKAGGNQLWTPEMRANLVKAVRKEREDRSVDNSQHCSAVARVLREWQFKNSGVLSGRIGNTPPGSSSENYVNTLSGRTT